MHRGCVGIVCVCSVADAPVVSASPPPSLADGHSGAVALAALPFPAPSQWKFSMRVQPRAIRSDTEQEVERTAQRQQRGDTTSDSQPQTRWIGTALRAALRSRVDWATGTQRRGRCAPR